jgi:hypothetical protein
MKMHGTNVRFSLAFVLLLFSMASMLPSRISAQTAKSLRGDDKPDSNFDDRPERSNTTIARFPPAT